MGRDLNVYREFLTLTSVAGKKDPNSSSVAHVQFLRSRKTIFRTRVVHQLLMDCAGKKTKRERQEGERPE